MRAARERAERAEEVDPSRIPQLAQNAFVAPRAAPNIPTNRMRPPMPPPAGSRSGQLPIGVAISQPVQAPQWPLAGSIEGGPAQYQPPRNRVPPQRPPRPSQVPSMIDTAYLAERSPEFHYGQEGGRYEEEDQFSPEIISPLSQSSRPSTMSSVGSIPDFPVPMPSIGPPRRSAHLGPPPSSRRGASSYYSQASFVSPIPEESPRPSHQSYASSAAMPTSWGSDSPRELYEEDDYEDETMQDDLRYINSPIDERGESRESNGDDSDDRGLIRSASFGKRAKASMITTKSSDRVEQVRPAPMPQQNLSSLGKTGFGAIAGALAVPTTRDALRETPWPTTNDGPGNSLASGTGLIDGSTSSGSEETLPTIARGVNINEPALAYTPTPADPKSNAILGAYNAASSLQPGPSSPLRTPSPGFSRLSAIRRPPRLDMNAVRDAEARGSLTSLPDLIARATKLAAMMDIGKRPGSRMALDDFARDNDFGLDKEIGSKFCSVGSGILLITKVSAMDDKHKSNLSGMLAAFPPPGVQTPRNGTPVRPTSTWPTGFDPDSGNGDQQKGPKKPRRCCGLPVWAFILVLFVLLIAAAAAIVVPLEFLVFHKNTPSSTNTLSAVQKCEADSTTSCKNGGSSILDGTTCACICTNGFTGSTCTSANATGCTTTTLSGLSSANVTLGDSISRLITGAQTNFSIPLSASTLIARFNSNSLSCATENALVTFDGQSVRVGAASDMVNAATSSSTSSSTTATPTAAKHRRDIHFYQRDTTSTTSSSNPSIATASGGIIYDAGTSTSSATASPTASVIPTSVFPITEEVLDFARVAVLYILQQENLEQATNAQSTLQHFFSLESFTNMAAANVSLGNDNVINLVRFSVNLGNGSVGAVNSSLTRRGGVESWGGGIARLWETPL